MNTTRVTNGLDPDPDQERHSVSPDLGPNCLQMFNQQMAKFMAYMITISDVYQGRREYRKCLTPLCSVHPRMSCGKILSKF